MSGAWERLQREVIRAGLCTRCGACAAVSGGAVGFPDRTGECLPQLLGQPGEVPEAAWHGCSGRDVHFPALNEQLFGGRPDSWLLGHCRQRWIAYASDSTVRRNGASGGVLSAVATHLLRTGRVGGVWVQGMDSRRPYLPASFLACTEDDILAAAQSKYVLSPHMDGLQDLQETGEPLAFVGLPCQVHALRKLQLQDHPIAQRFRYVLGPYCGNILHFHSIRDFLVGHGVHDLSQVVSLDFRAGEWPGNLRIELAGGRVLEMPKFHANYLIPFHIVQRCLLCTDLSNEFADIAGGDAWAPDYEQRGKGFSLLVARSARGEELLEEMRNEGRIETLPLREDDAIAMHSHGLDLKKRGAFLRITRRRRAGLPVPEYGYRLADRVSRGRLLMETLMGWIFRVCWTRPARFAVHCIPDRWIGMLFQVARTWWKRGTRSTKKTGLGAVRFDADENSAAPPASQEPQ